MRGAGGGAQPDSRVGHDPRTHSLRILGIDPGSRVTGFGVLRSHGGSVERLDSGCIRVRGKTPERALANIQSELAATLRTWSPDVVVIEAVFVHRSARSALVLGQARGAALASCGAAGVGVAEYSPAEIKSAVTGYGRADKAQVQSMVARILGLPDRLAADEADALAAALCHAQRGSLRAAVERGSGAGAAALAAASVAVRSRGRGPRVRPGLRPR